MQALQNLLSATKHRASAPPTGISLIAHAAAAVPYTVLTVTTAGINTTGANFIAIVAQSDGLSSNTLSDSNSNTWTSETSNTAGTPNLYFCAAPTVGAGHTFTLVVPTTNTCSPSIAVAAFSGVNATPFESVVSGYEGTSGAVFQPGVVNPSPNDLCIVGVGGTGSGTGVDGTTVDSGFTITDAIKSGAYIYTAVALAYLVYSSGDLIATWSSATTYPKSTIVTTGSGANWLSNYSNTNQNPTDNDGWWTAPGVTPAGNVAPTITVTAYGNGWGAFVASFAHA
jgi:hypothetical protein